MNQLEAGAMETVTAQKSALYIDSNTNRNTTATNKQDETKRNNISFSDGVITLEMLA